MCVGHVAIPFATSTTESLSTANSRSQYCRRIISKMPLRNSISPLSLYLSHALLDFIETCATLYYKRIL